MIVFPNGKINLGLNIVKKRADGFHNIESLLYPVPIYDALEFKASSGFSIEVLGKKIHGNTEDNILFKTWKLLHDRLHIPPIEIKLLKGIPVGAGLGGGSSDAMFLLKSLNSYFKLNLTSEIILSLGATLGSDCPFFVDNSQAIIKGRGEVVLPVNFSLNSMLLIIVCPDFQISTQEAFANIKTGKRHYQIEDLIKKPIEKWQNALVNDFEEVAFLKYPILQTIKDTLLINGAVYASLTGSGSALYGIFKQPVNMNKCFPDYFIWNGILK